MKRKILIASTLFIMIALAWALPATIAQVGGGGIIQPRQSLSLNGLPNANIYALDNDNTLWLRQGCTSQGFTRQFAIRNVTGQVIGIDYRPADGKLYALTDTNGVYRIDTASGRATLVSVLTTNFTGGVQSVMDFNPVANAIRLIGSNNQNYAVVNGTGDLTRTAPQTQITYAAGDVNAGANPNICGGAYTNNIAGATTTIFYALDYTLDTLVTIAGPLVGAGSSNTGGGQLQTIGSLFNGSGQAIDISPTTDLDIYTIGNTNFAVGVSGRTIFTINISQIKNLPLGQTQPVAVQRTSLPEAGFIDLAISTTRCGRNP